MVGLPQYARDERNAKIKNYGFRWCDRPGYVGASKNMIKPTPYLLCTTYGWISVKEEIYCWRVALHGKMRLSCREAYGRDFRREGNPSPTAKHWQRIAELKELHERGCIDIEKGPWSYYGIPEEFPDARYKPKPVGYDDV